MIFQQIESAPRVVDIVTAVTANLPLKGDMKT